MENGAALVATSQVLAVQPLDDVSMLLQTSVEPVLSSERLSGNIRTSLHSI
jgi:hypothetical protein